MTRKSGIITLIEERENIETAKSLVVDIREKLSNLLHYRLNSNTVIFIRKDKDINSQVEKYLKALNSDRKNY